MTETQENHLTFVPSLVEGVDDVSEVTVYPDRLELTRTEGEAVVIEFLKIARWHRRGWLYRLLAKIGWRVRGNPPVAERDWFHPPPERFFRFYTNPVITIYMPGEAADVTYPDTHFRRVQDVMFQGGFGTFDLG